MNIQKNKSGLDDKDGNRRTKRSYLEKVKVDFNEQNEAGNNNNET